MPRSNTRLLLVEEDRSVRISLERRLKFEGFHVVGVDRGEIALDVLGEVEPDLVVLDVKPAGPEGFEITERMRKVSTVPIVILTARDSLEDRVSGLERGADDYLVKPYELPELLARIRALLRRTYLLGNHSRSTEENILSHAGIQLGQDTRDVSIDGETIKLTPREFSVLEYFLRHPRQVLSREQILTGVWGPDTTYLSNLVDVYVLQLRKKLEANERHRRLYTVRGVGYTLRESDE